MQSLGVCKYIRFSVKLGNDYFHVFSMYNDFRYMNSYICTAVKKRIEEILAAKNTTEQVVENMT